MNTFIKVTKDGQQIEISPLALEDHKRLGWVVVGEPSVLGEGTLADIAEKKLALAEVAKKETQAARDVLAEKEAQEKALTNDALIAVDAAKKMALAVNIASEKAVKEKAITDKVLADKAKAEAESTASEKTHHGKRT